MDQFKFFFKEGANHILELEAFDHMLFVVALCALYLAQDWNKVLILVTAFTIGHFITLALSTLDILSFPSDIIEFLIPVTIFVAAFSNILRKTNTLRPGFININYFFALFFGLIHGLGYAYQLKSIMGRSQSIVTELLAFNLGLELGQIIIVGIFMVISFIFVGLAGVTKRDWNLVISAAIAGVAIMLMIETKFW
jgi:hypothetical protein